MIRASLSRRHFSLALLLLGAAMGCRRPVPFPAETTPEGAYARVSLAIAEGRPRDVFAYLEDEAQWAAHTIQRERATALAAAKKSFPKAELAALDATIGSDARAKDGHDVFVRLAKARGFFQRLRRDLSGVAKVELAGDRATVVTARGTRHPMKRRQGGIWGMTAFTAELIAEAEKATRDRAQIEQAARDYGAVSGTHDAGP